MVDSSLDSFAGDMPSPGQAANLFGLSLKLDLLMAQRNEQTNAPNYSPAISYPAYSYNNLYPTIVQTQQPYQAVPTSHIMQAPYHGYPSQPQQIHMHYHGYPQHQIYFPPSLPYAAYTNMLRPPSSMQAAKHTVAGKIGQSREDVASPSSHPRIPKKRRSATARIQPAKNMAVQESEEDVQKWLEARRKRYPGQQKASEPSTALVSPDIVGSAVASKENNSTEQEPEQACQQQSKSRRLCRHFVRDSCRHGDRCKFSHDRNKKSTNIPEAKPSKKCQKPETMFKIFLEQERHAQLARLLTAFEYIIERNFFKSIS